MKFRLLNSYLIAGNSNWWPRVLDHMAPCGLGLTVYRWLRQVRHRLLVGTLPRWSAGDYQLISHPRVWLHVILLLQHGPRCRPNSPAGTNLESFNEPGTVHLQPVLREVRTLNNRTIEGCLRWNSTNEEVFCSRVLDGPKYWSGEGPGLKGRGPNFKFGEETGQSSTRSNKFILLPYKKTASQSQVWSKIMAKFRIFRPSCKNQARGGEMTRYFGVVMCMSESLVGYTFDWRQLRGLPMRKSGKK